MKTVGFISYKKRLWNLKLFLNTGLAELTYTAYLLVKCTNALGLCIDRQCIWRLERIKTIFNSNWKYYIKHSMRLNLSLSLRTVLLDMWDLSQIKYILQELLLFQSRTYFRTGTFDTSWLTVFGLIVATKDSIERWKLNFLWWY